GVGYSLTFDPFKAVNGGGATNTSDVSGKVGLDLGASNLPDGDYTLEMIWEAKGLVEADGKTSYSSGGAWTFYGFCIGLMKAWSFPVPNGTNNSQTYVVRWLPTSGGIGDYSHYFSDYALNNQSGGKQAVCSSVSYVPQIINYTLKMDVTDNGGTKTARFTSYRNGIAATKIAEGVYGTCQLDNANTYTTYYGNEGNSSPLFRLMYNYPGTVYSVRVYNRILTEEEAAQNHLSDVVACYRLNLSRYFNLSEEQKAAVLPLLADAVKDVPLTDANSSDYAAKRKAVKASIDALLTGNSMENLYVSKGLKALFRAFSSSDAYNLSTGTWTSVGGDVTATLAGGAKSDANPGGWYADVSSGYAKGIRYAQSARQSGKTG
ncbi:MAG: hypothetical protein MJ078_07765, partial [Clostridia bacterium]|nr:hypothetical protein [Clostridia bacterium]